MDSKTGISRLSKKRIRRVKRRSQHDPGACSLGMQQPLELHECARRKGLSVLIRRFEIGRNLLRIITARKVEFGLLSLESWSCRFEGKIDNPPSLV